MAVMQLRRVAPGVYEGTGLREADQREVVVEIVTRKPDADGWRAEIDGEDLGDVFPTKNSAASAAEFWLKHAVRDQRFGWVLRPIK